MRYHTLAEKINQSKRYLSDGPSLTCNIAMNIAHWRPIGVWSELIVSALIDDEQLTSVIIDDLKSVRNPANVLMVHQPALLEGESQLHTLCQQSAQVLLLYEYEHDIPEWLRQTPLAAPHAVVALDPVQYRRLPRSLNSHYLAIGIPTATATALHLDDTPMVVGVLRDLRAANYQLSNLIDIESLPNDPLIQSYHIINPESLSTVQSLGDEVAQIDILVDHFSAHMGPSIAAFFALSQGRAVIGSNASTKESNAFTHEKLSPILNATPGTLANTLLSIAREKKNLRDLARRGREFIRVYHRFEAIRTQIHKIVESGQR